jgi:Uncharacterized protein containing SIS (Sugar ISomerase) phosphosugar binding domain
MNAAIQYYDASIELLRRIRETQLPALEKAAAVCANAIERKGLVFLFGVGHSRMMCEEMIPRQGCFVGFYPIIHLPITTYADIIGPNNLRTSLYLEKYEGYAEEILKGFKFGSHDVMLIISTSGIRPVIVEMALGAKRRGMPVIALCSLTHSNAAAPGHSSGKKLPDIADVVLDNEAPEGDCAVELPSLAWKTGPTSTLCGAMLINMLRCAIAEKLLERGVKPEMLPSHQFVGTEAADAAEKQLERFYEAYRRSVAHLFG